MRRAERCPACGSVGAAASAPAHRPQRKRFADAVDAGGSDRGETLPSRHERHARKTSIPATELVEEDEEQACPSSSRSLRSISRPAPGRSPPAARSIARHAKLAPSSPGVYRMIDANGDVLYVGKAKNIRKRIIAYTRPTGYDPRIERMIAATAALEFVSTATETEALLLEANLIKRLRPRFNVLLRDDKSFPYILITADHWAPQILKHRGARSREGNYYGPFASVWAVNRTITALQRAFLLRSCSDGFFESRTRPCLLYQIKRCSGPCTREIDFAEYSELVREANAFLSGKSQAVKERAGGRDGEGLRRARLRARRDLPRPARRALGGAGASGHQSARGRGGGRVRRPSGRRLQLRRRCSSSAPARTGAIAPISRRPTARSRPARCWARSSPSSTTTSRARAAS